METRSWRTFVTALGFAAMWSMLPPTASGAPAGARVTPNRPAAPAVTYAVRTGTDGEMILSADAGVLQIEKSVFADGHTQLVLKSDRDEATIAFGSDGATTVSGQSRVSVNAAQPDEAAFGRTRALLAQSKAARLFRDLTAAIDRRDEPPSAYEKLLFLADAEVARLEGDSKAVGSLANRLGLKKGGANPVSGGLRPVSCGAVRRVQYNDCVLGYELAIMGAWTSWTGCYRTVFDSVAWYLQNMELWFCDVEMFVRAEMYAFQFLRCIALPV